MKQQCFWYTSCTLVSRSIESSSWKLIDLGDTNTKLTGATTCGFLLALFRTPESILRCSIPVTPLLYRLPVTPLLYTCILSRVERFLIVPDLTKNVYSFSRDHQNLLQSTIFCVDRVRRIMSELFL
jgi:hypothetical protein